MFWFLFKKGETEDAQTQSKSGNVFKEYCLFFSEELKKQGKGLINSHDFKIVARAVIDGDYYLLDYKEIPELPYPIEEIAEYLKGMIKTFSEISKDIVNDDTSGDDYSNDKLKNTALSTVYLLSYLYKPKEQYKQRMFDEYVITEFRKLDVTWKYTIRDVEKLPYPREVILGSLIRKWKVAEDQEEKDILERGGYSLAFYQEGVGVEDLHMIGMDTDKYMKETGMDMVKDMK